MYFEGDLNAELEDDKEDKDPKRVVKAAKLGPYSGHSESKHHCRDGENVGNCPNEKVGPVEVWTVLTMLTASAEGDEGLSGVKQEFKIVSKFTRLI